MAQVHLTAQRDAGAASSAAARTLRFHRCHQSNFAHRMGQPGRLGKLLGKDIKSIFRDLIPIVVLPKLFPDSILRLLQAAPDGDL